MFTGSWTVEASEAVGTVDGDLDAVDTLASLLAQSLILIDESDPAEPRFRMLNTIRAYAREQLAERGAHMQPMVADDLSMCYRWLQLESRTSERSDTDGRPGD